MKALQVAITAVSAAIAQTSQPLSPRSLSALSRQIELAYEIDLAQQQMQKQLSSLETQVQKINQLSTELENAIADLKVIATQVNENSRFFRLKQRKAKRFKICEYRSAQVPVIRKRSNGCLVLMSRSVM